MGVQTNYLWTIITLRKLKIVLPSLKAPVEKFLRSAFVYQIEYFTAKCALLAKRADICKPDSNSISVEDLSRTSRDVYRWHHTGQC